MKTALINALKELLRVILLAVIPVLITSVEDGSLNWKVVGTVAILAALRFADKLLHEYGKETKKDVLIKGITRF